MKIFINNVLGKFDVKLVRKSLHEKLAENSIKFQSYELSELIDENYFIEYFKNLKFSKSQLRQDLFALSELGFKKSGYFVEFGATNGVILSNTHLMETKFGWNGILAEPAKIWHSSLKTNRSVAIETDCIWHSTGETLVFNEVSDKNYSGGLSTIDNFSNADHHRNLRKSKSNKYEVQTISLSDMLNKHNAPKEIDYLSIDTEGSEFEILNAFNFSEYNIKIITCEHNYTTMREKIHALLSSNGYERKFTEVSLWDDWYIKK